MEYAYLIVQMQSAEYGEGGVVNGKWKVHLAHEDEPREVFDHNSFNAPLSKAAEHFTALAADGWRVHCERPNLQERFVPGAAPNSGPRRFTFGAVIALLYRE